MLFEGPYGRLTDRTRSRRGLVLAGAGVGVTPLRSLVEGLDYPPGEAVLLQRYSDEPLFGAELDVLADERGLENLPLPGRRGAADSVLGPTAAGYGDELAALRSWVPDIADRDVYLCGPTPWTTGMQRLAAAAGVPADRIHVESFGW